MMRKPPFGVLAFVLTLLVLAVTWWPAGYYGFLDSCMQFHPREIDLRPAFCHHPLTAIAGWVWILALPVLLFWLTRRIYRFLSRMGASA